MHGDSDSKLTPGITKHEGLGSVEEYKCDVHFTKTAGRADSCVLNV